MRSRLSAFPKREVERGAFSHCGFRPDRPAVRGNNPLHDTQADLFAFELRRSVQALERTEQLCRILHVEAGAIVAHEIGRLAVAFGAADLDPCAPGAGREFPGVPEQVFQRDFYQAGIALDHQGRRDRASVKPGKLVFIQRHDQIFLSCRMRRFNQHDPSRQTRPAVVATLPEV